MGEGRRQYKAASRVEDGVEGKVESRRWSRVEGRVE